MPSSVHWGYGLWLQITTKQASNWNRSICWRQVLLLLGLKTKFTFHVLRYCTGKWESAIYCNALGTEGRVWGSRCKCPHSRVFPGMTTKEVLCSKPEVSWGAFMLMPRFRPIKTPAPGRLHEICPCHPGVGNCAWAGPPRLHYNFSQACYRGGLCVMCCVHCLLFWNLRVGNGVYLEI